MVNTIAGKLGGSHAAPESSDQVGGSTWSFDIWRGHPLEDDVDGTLGQIRAMLSELRARFDRANAENPGRASDTRVVVYEGQCIIGDEDHGVEEDD